MPWKNVSFAYPWVLLLIPLSIFIVVLFLWKGKRQRPSITFPLLLFIHVSPLNHIRIWLRRIVFGCLLMGWCAWIIALSRPQRHEDISHAQVLGVDMMIVLDTSGSMEFEDFKPNRFDVAVTTIENFIKKRTHDRMGLIVFGGDSFTLCPLTLDHDILLQSLKRSRTNMTKSQGTAIGIALANAVGRLKDSKAKTRAIVLVTDGDNNAGSVDPITAAELAKGFGIKIYSIGVGKDGMVPVPLKGVDLLGRPTKYYKQVHSTMDFEFLKHISSITSGEAFRAESESTLKNIFDRIDALEKTKIEGLKLTRIIELFRWPLAIGTLLLTISQVLLGTFLRLFP